MTSIELFVNVKYYSEHPILSQQFESSLNNILPLYLSLESTDSVTAPNSSELVKT